MTTLKYRTMDELLDEVRVDLKNYSAEGQIEVAELIKVAQRVNYDLGLKINMVKETILDINNSLAKMPADFYILNFALLCHHYKVVTSPSVGGIQKDDWVVMNNSGSTCDTSCGPTALDSIPPASCNLLNPDPWFQRKVYTLCDSKIGVVVVENHSVGEVRYYEHFDRFYVKPSREASSFTLNSQFRDCPNTGQLKNGFMKCNIPRGKLYVNYEGALEDNDGNLLVLDHPFINEYYEYAIKVRIIENLYINGEPDIERRLQFLQNNLKVARINALSLVNMPDYADIKKSFELNRRIMKDKYFNTFDRYFGLNSFAISTQYV